MVVMKGSRKKESVYVCLETCLPNSMFAIFDGTLEETVSFGTIGDLLSCCHALIGHY